jgi:surface polysaccharide O-acyltransferase-like enzyme
MEKITSFLKENMIVLGLGLFVVMTILILNEEIGQLWKYWAKVIGPTIYVLFPMGVILISIVLLIALGRMNEKFPSVRELQLIEEGAPIVGLLGTVIALVKGFGQLDITHSVDSSINVMIGTISESLYATPTGLSLGLLAWFVRKRFLKADLEKSI